MFSDEKHVCMLPAMPRCTSQPPTASALRRLLCALRHLMMACDWHHGAALFIRSQKSLQREWQRQLTSGYWMVLHPYSPLKFFWDCFDLIINFLAFFYMPMHVFYDCPNPYDPYILFVDATCFLKILANFVTGRFDVDNRCVILAPKAIVKLYLCDNFACDLIGALPLQLIQPFANCEYPSHTAMFLFKLFRLVSIKRAWTCLHEQIELSYIVSTTIAVMVQATVFFHWMTYIHFQIPALCANFYEMDGRMLVWLRRFRVISDQGNQWTALQKYIVNLYYVSGLCIGAGVFSPVNEHVLPELLLNSVLGLIGLVFTTHSFTTMLCLIVYKHYENYLYNGRLKELHEYLIFKRLPRSLQQKIQLFINYKFNGHYFNEQSIMNTVNERIKQDINMFCCKRLVIKVPLFQDMPVALINTIIFSLCQVLYMPGEILVKCGDPGSSIYLIAFGTVAVMNAEGREVAHLKDGAFFGERTLLSPGTPRSATVVALEITEIYKLNNEQLQACLQPCPRFKRRLEQAARERRTRTVRRGPHGY